MPNRTPTPRINNFDDLSNDALIRLKDLMAFKVIPFSSTTLWRKIKSRTFPEPEKISLNIVAFKCGDIRAWLEDPSSFIAAANTPSQKNDEVANDEI